MWTRQFGLDSVVDIFVTEFLLLSEATNLYQSCGASQGPHSMGGLQLGSKRMGRLRTFGSYHQVLQGWSAMVCFLKASNLSYFNQLGIQVCPGLSIYEGLEIGIEALV